MLQKYIFLKQGNTNKFVTQQKNKQKKTHTNRSD